MVYKDRFCLFIKSIYFDLARTTSGDRKFNKWKINVSNEDLSIVDTFWIKTKGDRQIIY